MELKKTGLDEEIVKAIREIGFKSFTSIQEKAIPKILAGQNVVVQSKTGSGKTAVFGLPVVHKVKEKKGLQALILVPTRELCLQVSRMLKEFAKFKNVKIVEIIGGELISKQEREIKDAEIVVATPGRTLDLIKNYKLRFDHLRFLVIDEVDRMSDFGFIGDLEKIIEKLPPRQTMVFSATINRDVEKLIFRHMKNAIFIYGEKKVEGELLKQIYYEVSRREKFSLLVHLLKQNYDGLSLVFCKKRQEAELVAKNVRKNGLNAVALHGGLKHSKRVKNIQGVINQKFDVIVATDLASRGLDLKGIKYVYNYDLPQSTEDYIHRIGRTARMENKGIAITLITPEDLQKFRKILEENKIQKEKTPIFEHVQFHTKTRKHIKKPTWRKNSY